MFRSVNLFLIMIILGTLISWSQAWQSSRVQMDVAGKLTYATDGEGNRIPDFSYAGYRNSEVEIPFIETVLTISPIAGDNTAHIQNAIDAVGAMELNVDGFRGALYLEAGEYECSGSLYMDQSGVVLRGAGDGSDPSSNTVIIATGNTPHQRNFIVAGGGSANYWRDSVANTTKNIVTELVSVGSQTFEVSDASPYQIGDNIVIHHPSTTAWLQAINYGGTHGGPAWSDHPIVFNRFIKNIQGNMITIDAPVFNHLNRSLSQSYIYRYSREGLVTNIGIEDLYIDCEISSNTDETHAWNTINLYEIEDAWVRNCTVLHYGLSGYRTNTATRVTIENCQALFPASKVEGSRRYNFQFYTASQLVLIKDCHAGNGRHHYVSNGESYTSGCVVLNCTSTRAYTSSEGHRHWSMGLLFDNLRELDGPRDWWNPRLIGFYNRGDYGTSHGWASAHSVCWNCDAAGGTIAIQKPPTAQNYAIGCSADKVTGSDIFTIPFDEPTGFIEGTNSSGLEPASLFEAQLADRLRGSDGETDPITDSFSDGDFLADPGWVGDINMWEIATNSDVSSGAPLSYTLRLNATDAVSGIKYLSLQRLSDWGESQSWGFWMGRRNSAASNSSKNIVWLWANESDLTSPTVDGYRIRFGDDSGNDGIVLERVDNGSPSSILFSSGSVPNGLTDIGFLVRVTRSKLSGWILYTSVLPTQSGQGAIATNTPNVSETDVYQGFVSDAIYTSFNNGYFGFMAAHTADFYSREGAEFDQLYFDPITDGLWGSDGETDPITDSFSDGDFTANPGWDGDINMWQIVTNSDVSSGANSSYTLRLNATELLSGIKYLCLQRTAEWGESQSWGFWMGRRNSAASNSSKNLVWLWASESDLTSSTVDGYRLRFGDDSGNDGIVLERVTNGSSSSILFSSGSVLNGLTDIGFLVRVTRSNLSGWTLYTSVLPTQSGQGAIATYTPNVGQTYVYQGFVSDATYTSFNNGYFGFMAVHTTDFDSRVGAEFDQLYFDPSMDGTLPIELLSFTAKAGDGRVDLNWSTASELENIGFIVMRSEEENNIYSEYASYKNNNYLTGAGTTSEENSYHYVDYDVGNNITYWYKLLDVDLAGKYSEHGPVSAMPGERVIAPEIFNLNQNFPNPFNQTTTIEYSIPQSSLVELTLYDLAGKKRETLVRKSHSPGYYNFRWDGSNYASGVYIYQIKADNFVQSKKLLLIK